jgi:uncharacterized membrane protein YkoI
MLKLSLKRFATTVTVLLALVATPAMARDKDHDNGNQRGNSNAAAQSSRMSAEQASAIVRGAYGGRVVSVKSAGNGYNVRVLLDGGRVKTVYVDSSGRLSESN